MCDVISKAFKKPELRVLCFGDSLTEGYSQFGLVMTPYSETLKTELDVKFWAGKEKRKVKVATDGESGDRVITGSFKDRMNAQCGF
jgi:lysophospholipase L1-like esterase